MKKRVGFLGCGQMGRALLNGLLISKTLSSDEVIISAKTTAKQTATELGVSFGTPQEVINTSEILILAIKPQQLKSLKSWTHTPPDQLSTAPLREPSSSQLLISLLAGTSRAQIKEQLGSHYQERVQLIRVMPNLPSMIQRGVTLIHRPEDVSEIDFMKCSMLFKAIGHVECLSRETDFHSATAIAGSGPAYFCLVLEAMADAGVLLGLKREVAQRLAAYTMWGSGQMLTQSHPALLKDQITSPAGVTICGLRSLEQNGTRSAWIEAIQSATDRSKEMEEL